MGDLRRIGEIVQHNAAMRGEPENWITIKFDEAGSLLEIMEGDGVRVDRDDSRVIISAGGTHVKVTPEASVTIAAGIAKHAPDVKADEVAAAVDAEQAKFDSEREQRRAEIDAEVAAHAAEKQAEIDALDKLIEQKKAEAGIEAVGADATADGLLTGKNEG